MYQEIPQEIYNQIEKDQKVLSELNRRLKKIKAAGAPRLTAKYERLITDHQYKHQAALKSLFSKHGISR